MDREVRNPFDSGKITGDFVVLNTREEIFNALTAAKHARDDANFGEISRFETEVRQSWDPGGQW